MARPCPRRFVAAVLDGPAPTDLRWHFVRLELLRMVMEQRLDHGATCMLENGVVDLIAQVSECIVGDRGGFVREDDWLTLEKAGSYLSARFDFVLDEDTIGSLSLQVNSVMCIWDEMMIGIIRAVRSWGDARPALEASLHWIESAISGNLEHTHPGVTPSVAWFIQPAGR